MSICEAGGYYCGQKSGKSAKQTIKKTVSVWIENEKLLVFFKFIKEL